MWRGAAQTEVLSASVDAVRIRPCARATARGREPRRGKRAQKRPVSASARERSSGSACRDDAERVGVREAGCCASARRLTHFGRWPVANYTRVCRGPLSSAGSQAVGTGRSRGQSASQGIVDVPCAAADAVTLEYSQHGGPSPRLRAQTRRSPRLRDDRAQRPSRGAVHRLRMPHGDAERIPRR